MKHIAHHNSRAQSSNWPCTFDSPQTATTQTRRSEFRPCTWQNPIEGSVVNACSGPYLGKGEPWRTPNRRALCFLSRPRIPWSSIEDLDAVEFILRCFSKGKCFRLHGDSGWVLKLQDAARQLPVPSSSLVYYPDLPGCNLWLPSNTSGTIKVWSLDRWSTRVASESWKHETRKHRIY